LIKAPPVAGFVPLDGGVNVSFQVQSRFRLIVSPGKNVEIPTCKTVRQASAGVVPGLPFDPPLQST
jgi:hypothetical protein